MVPPDPVHAQSARADETSISRPPLSGDVGYDKYNQVQLMTMSAIDFLDQWFETDVLKATMSASGIIGTFLGVRSPGTAYVCCITTWEKSTAHSAPGDSLAAAPAQFPMQSATRPAKRESRSAPRLPSRKSS
jgi:hypothetical protein